MSNHNLVVATPILLAAGRVTANGQSTGVDVSSLEGFGLVVQAADAVSGTTPTLTEKLQESDTQGGTYTDVAAGAFTQLTTVDGVAKLAIDFRAVKAFLRVDDVVSGTSPVYDRSVVAIGWPKSYAP